MKKNNKIIYDYNLTSLKKQIDNGQALKYVVNQTKEICEFSVKKYPLSLQFVKNKTNKICQIAIKKNPESLKYILSPSLDLQMLAVSKNGHIIKYIKNPNEDVCKKAVAQNCQSIIYIDHPSIETCLIAIKKNPETIRYIKQATHEMILLALSLNPKLTINFIKNLNSDYIDYAMSINYETIFRIIDRSLLKAHHYHIAMIKDIRNTYFFPKKYYLFDKDIKTCLNSSNDDLLVFLKMLLREECNPSDLWKIERLQLSKIAMSLLKKHPNYNNVASGILAKIKN